MTKAELVKTFSKRAGITYTEGENILSILEDTITDGLLDDGKVNLVGFGAFEVKKHAAHVCHNFKDGGFSQVKETKKVCFRPGSKLDKIIKG